MKRILGIGNALVDIMTPLENDDFLSHIGLAKGSMELVDLDTSKKILSQTEGLKKTLTSGGSTANTIYGIAKLTGNAGYIGKINKDKYGDFFASDMKKAGVNMHLSYSDSTPTGVAVALVSPDSERTFATYLGAAVELSANELNPSIFSQYDLLHLEGYLIFDEELVMRALHLAKQYNLLVSIDLASFNVVEIKKDFLKKIIKDYIDIVFANEEEAKAYTGLEAEDALHKIAEEVQISVVKTGGKGSMIKHNDTIYKVDAIKVNAIDTTGAGDFYAAGFLYGMTQHYPLDKCGRIGSYLAGRVVEVIGAKPAKDVWAEIKNIN